MSILKFFAGFSKKAPALPVDEDGHVLHPDPEIQAAMLRCRTLQTPLSVLDLRDALRGRETWNPDDYQAYEEEIERLREMRHPSAKEFHVLVENFQKQNGSRQITAIQAVVIRRFHAEFIGDATADNPK